MSRRINIDEIGLEICNVVPFANDTYEGVKFEWESKIGFGVTGCSLFPNSTSNPTRFQHFKC